MENYFEARAYVVGDNIDTDQIIPACHLVYSLTDDKEKKKYGEYAMSGLPEQLYSERFIGEGECKSDFGIIVAGKNFGSGSSREQAPACLQIAGVKAVIAKSFARIFYRNSINGAFITPLENERGLNKLDVSTGDLLGVDLTNYTLKNITKDISIDLDPLGEAGDILRDGGIFNYEV